MLEPKKERICVAQITTAHGIKGFVRLKIFTENPEELENYNPLFTSKDKDDTLIVKLKNPVKNQWLAEIEGIDDRNDAEKLRGIELFINADVLPAIEDENTFYQRDLVGLMAVTKSGQDVGEVLKIENFGAGDLIEIKPSGSSSFYLPFKDTYVGNVDLEERTLEVFDYEDYIIL